MPIVDFDGGFAMCDTSRGRCRGESCTFAHNRAELRQWNRKKLGPRWRDRGPGGGHRGGRGGRGPGRREGRSRTPSPSSSAEERESSGFVLDKGFASNIISPPQVRGVHSHHIVPPKKAAVTDSYYRDSMMGGSQHMRVPKLTSPASPISIWPPLSRDPVPVVEVDQPVSLPPPPPPPPGEYAAKKNDFADRLEEELVLGDVQVELARTNYKEKFHKLLCWEEKTHIEILEKRLV